MRPNAHERVGTLRGIAAGDEELFIALAHRLGGEAFFHFQDSPTNSQGLSELNPNIEVVEGYDLNNIPPFQELTHRDQLIIKKHFWEFSEQYRPDIAKRIAGKAFNALVDTSQAKWIISERRTQFLGERKPYPGLILKKVRIDHKIPNTLEPGYYHFNNARLDQLASYAIVVGSLIDAEPKIRLTGLKRGPNTDSLVNSLLDKLKNQIKN